MAAGSSVKTEEWYHNVITLATQVAVHTVVGNLREIHIYHVLAPAIDYREKGLANAKAIYSTS